MKTDILVIKAKTAPVVEMDSEASAIYIRFLTSKVAKTLPRPSEKGFFAVDLDDQNQVIGIEIIGCAEVEIRKALKQAHIKAPNLDYSRTRIVNKSALVNG